MTKTMKTSVASNLQPNEVLYCRISLRRLFNQILLGFSLLDYYIRFILYFPRIVICIFLGLYSLAYIRPPLVLVI